MIQKRRWIQKRARHSKDQPKGILINIPISQNLMLKRRRTRKCDIYVLDEFNSGANNSKIVFPVYLYIKCHILYLLDMVNVLIFRIFHQFWDLSHFKGANARVFILHTHLQ